MSDHGDDARLFLERALAKAEAAAEAGDDPGPWPELAAAGIHSVLHLADTIRHALRDVVYELRD